MNFEEYRMLPKHKMEGDQKRCEEVIRRIVLRLAPDVSFSWDDSHPLRTTLCWKIFREKPLQTVFIVFLAIIVGSVDEARTSGVGPLAGPAV